MSETNKSFSDLFTAAEQHDEYWTEQAILQFTEELAQWMAIRKISRAELAQAIGTSQPYVTKILKGNVNFTLATMTKLAHAMGATLQIHLAPRDGAVQAVETARDKAPKRAAGGGGHR